jgi:hypothetical protein
MYTEKVFDFLHILRLRQTGGILGATRVATLAAQCGSNVIETRATRLRVVEAQDVMSSR